MYILLIGMFFCGSTLILVLTGLIKIKNHGRIPYETDY